VHPLQWLSQRDRDFAALRRAGRAAIVMPSMFALGDEVIANPILATFAAFGSFAMLLLADFSGPLRERLQAQAALALTGLVLVTLGTVASETVWSAVIGMAIVGFAVIFAGVISSVLAGATTSLPLAFILPVTLAGGVSSLPDRLAGWAMAGGAAFVAVAVLWPTPKRDGLRATATNACRALATQLREEVTYVLSGRDAALAHNRDHAVELAGQALAAMHAAFLATPYRPATLSTSGRTIVRLVDELNWLGATMAQAMPPMPRMGVDRSALAIKVAAAAALDAGADVLDTHAGACGELHEAADELDRALEEAASRATASVGVDGAGELASGEVISALDPGFRAQVIGVEVSAITRNIDLAAAAERRSWLDRVLGREPSGLIGQLTVARRRATAHVDRNSVWLHNSVRGAAGLALAVLVATETGVQHSFWVVLGTLSVLRSNALNTGQNVLRGILGTVVGFIVAGGLVELIGTDRTLLWFLLPLAILLAGVAPAAISFAAGQAAFTLTLVFLYNIIQPAGWRVGLLRVEDIALGCAVSLLVGLLFWPRGAGPALRRALADAYRESAAYLAGAVDFGTRRCDAGADALEAPAEEASRAGAAARRLDDAFRSFLAERGAKPVPLPEVTALLAGAGGLRLAAAAVIDLWQHEDGDTQGDRTGARRELLHTSEVVSGWYQDLAASLVNRHDPRAPLERDEAADRRLVDAVRADLRSDDGEATATAVRMIWTGDHLDGARRAQQLVIEPARHAAHA
jgi:uncharacterized membrane protein YccC